LPKGRVERQNSLEDFLNSEVSSGKAPVKGRIEFSLLGRRLRRKEIVVSEDGPIAG
jgi:hypothetical protein